MVRVVDDEPIIRRMASIALASIGFRVAVADNGITGLETYEALRDQICLVLSDIKMPSCSGIELAERVLELNPSARLSLMSGYSDDGLVMEAKNRFSFINKPFFPADLIRKIRLLLGAADPTAD